MKSIKSNQRGFTILELLIATMVFSVILLVCTAMVLAVGKNYTKGVNSTLTQEAARNIIDNVSQSIQFEGGSVREVREEAGHSGFFYFCTGTRRYVYVFNTQYPQDASHGFVWDTPKTCDDPSTASGSPEWPATNPTELLNKNLRIVKFELCKPGITTNCTHPTPGTSQLYSITVRVVYGKDDLLIDTNDDNIKDSCRSDFGTEFCAASELTTIVQKRL